MRPGRKPRLSAEAVRAVREWYAQRQREGRKTGVPVKRMEVRYGMTGDALWQIATGKTYRWVS